MSNIGTVVGNIIATIPTVQVTAKKAIAGASSGRLGIPIIGPMFQAVASQEARARPKMDPPTTIRSLSKTRYRSADRYSRISVRLDLKHTIM
jgi:hypothetical protein